MPVFPNNAAEAWRISSRTLGRFELGTLTLRSPKIPEEFSGYRIVHLTDLHYGGATRRVLVEEALSIAAHLSPDLLIVTGDFVVAGISGAWHRLATLVDPKLFKWNRYRRRVRQLTRELSSLLADFPAPDGILAVPGNHDYHEGFSTIRRYFPESLKFLINDHHSIYRDRQSFSVSGVDDVKYGKVELSGACNGSRESGFRILLSHNPDVVLNKQAEKINNFDLMLCGHTHGGQIRLPVYGPLRTATKQKQHVRGLSFFDSTAVYVNSGIGHIGLPLRLNCPPEILCIDLFSAKSREALLEREK